MCSRHMFFVALTASLMLLVSATPTALSFTAMRMEESPAPETTELVIEQPALPEETPVAVPEQTTPTIAEAPEEEPTPSVEALATSTDSTASVPFFSYNVGGDAFGQVQADPVQYVVGETLVFNMPDALISGANAALEPVYKSHRYGMLGSVWGYDLPVSNPGIYTCKLHYCETFSDFFTEEPNRTFEVTLVGDAEPDTVHRAEFDVMVELGGREFTAYDSTFQNIAISEMLELREDPSKGDAFLSGITCLWTAPL
eukprot:TRINITY_DN22273_c0_g1_i1.p1 TRINITY_DN22273_c0_g1~~TRINITY_DN22273_c0_g1_i1.p1  ORF type:complete len:256 (+),score=42.46 TRINITY_DN22273_c0_g1_i1:581-1348(+)